MRHWIIGAIVLCLVSVARAKAPATTQAFARDDIAGRVSDADGKPIEGALVDVWSWYKGNETHTDADGRFVLRKLGHDEPVEIRISKEGYGFWYKVDQPTGVEGLWVRLTSKTFFEGVVKAPDGKPVPHALVRADFGPKRNPGVTIGDVWVETTADDQGHYRMYVMPDAYEFHVRVPNVGVARTAKTPIGDGENKKLDIQLEEGLTLNVLAKDSITGEPVPGVRLFVWQQKGIDAKSGPDGHIQIDGLQPGKLEFQVEAPGYARWWSEQALHPWQKKTLDDGKWQRNFDSLEFTIERGTRPLTVELEKAVTITGVAVDPDGKPVAGATVAPARTGSGNSLTGDTRFSVTSKKDGTFRMLLPASGEAQYNLVVHDGKFQQWRRWANGVNEPFQTTPGQKIDGVTMKLERPAMVKGRAIDAQGKPVADREVRAHAADKRENRYYDPTTRTDKDGRFELKLIRPGEQFIQVAPFWLTAEEAPKNSTVKVKLEAGEVKDDVELTAAPQDRR